MSNDSCSISVAADEKVNQQIISPMERITSFTSHLFPSSTHHRFNAVIEAAMRKKYLISKQEKKYVSVLFPLRFSLIFNEHRYGANESLENYWSKSKKHFNIFFHHQTFRSSHRKRARSSRCVQRVFSLRAENLHVRLIIRSKLINQTTGRSFETARCNMQRD